MTEAPAAEDEEEHDDDDFQQAIKMSLAGIDGEDDEEPLIADDSKKPVLEQKTNMNDVITTDWMQDL